MAIPPIRASAALVVLVAALGLPAPAAQRPADASPAALLLAEARTLSAEGNDAAALALLERIAEAFPDAPEAPRALLEAATAARRVGDPAAARRALARLSERHPTSPQAAGAALEAVELDLAGAATPADLERAVAALAEIPGRWPGGDATPARAGAGVRRGELLLLLGRPDAAAAALVAALEAEPPSPWTARAALGLGRAELAAGRLADAASLLQEAADHPSARPEVVARARRTITLLHRLHLRPLAGGARWTAVSSVGGPGIELDHPVAVAAADDGSLLIADAGADALLLLPAAGPPLRIAARDPLEALRDGAGGAWAIAGDALLAVGASPTPPRLGEPDGERPLRQPVAAARGPLGHWLLLSGRGDRLLLYDPAGRPLGPLSAGREPVDVAFGGHRFHVLERDAGAVLRFGLAGDPEGSVASGDWRRPVALAVDPLGHLFVLDRGERRIDVLSPAGELLDRLGPVLPGGVELRAPEDLAVDGSGRLYVADPRRGEVLVLE